MIVKHKFPHVEIHPNVWSKFYAHYAESQFDVTELGSKEWYAGWEKYQSDWGIMVRLSLVDGVSYFQSEEQMYWFLLNWS